MSPGRREALTKSKSVNINVKYTFNTVVNWYLWSEFVKVFYLISVSLVRTAAQGEKFHFMYLFLSRYYQQFQIILYNIHRRTLTCLHPLKGLQPIIRYLKSADTGAECAPASKTHATHFIFPRIDLMLGSNTLTKQVK